MKFTEKQIEKVSALRTEFATRINSFALGVDYVLRTYENTAKNGSLVKWLDDMLNNINELVIEEMKIADTDISGFDEADFYVFLGRYFERIYAAAKNADEWSHSYFYSIIGVYQKNVMEVLKE